MSKVKMIRVHRKTRILRDGDCFIYRPGTTIPTDHVDAKELLRQGSATEFQAEASPAKDANAGEGAEVKFASKSVAEFAEENGVSAADLVGKGTGADGKVKKADVKAVIKARG